MKHILLTAFLALAALSAAAQTTTPTADSWEARTRNPANNGTIIYYLVPDGAVDQLASYSGATNGPVYLKLGAGLARSGTTLTTSPSSAQISDSTAIGRAVLTAANAAAARTAIGAAASTSGFDGQYSSLTGIPASFTPTAHTQASTTISDSTSAGRAILTAPDASTMRGLINVPSTADVAAGYYPLAGNPSAFLTGVTSAQVTTALGFTPYNATNPANYITAAVLSPYLTSTTAASTYATTAALTSGLAGKFNAPAGTTAQYLRGDGAAATFPTIPPAVTLTTTGSGAATFNAGTGALNIPTPTGSTPFNFSQPTARTLAVNTSYQALDTSKAAVIVPSYSCQNATQVLASSACTIQARMGTGTLTCATGTVYYTQSLTVNLGVLITQNSVNPVQINLPIGGSFILCPQVGTFTVNTVEQSAG